MKKTTTFLLFLLICLLPQAAWGDDPTYTANGVTWKYGLVGPWGAWKVEIKGETMGAANFSGALNIPDVIPYNGTNYPVGQIASSAFANYTNATAVTIPNSVTKIEWAAFKNSGITSVTLPNNSSLSIAGGAFEGCNHLTSLTIPDAVPTTAFAGSYSGGWPLKNCKGLVSVTVPNSWTTIPDFFLSGCENVTNFTLPAGITKIGDNAFTDCKNLLHVDASAATGLTEIGNNAFYRSGIMEPILPNGLTTVGSSAFSYCPNISQVTIPNSITNFGYSIFEGCEGLTNATIPSTMTSVPRRLFSLCHNLLHCNLPIGLISIEESAFCDCKNLTEDLTALTHITSFQNRAFYGCKKLTGHLTFPAGTQTIGVEAFKNCAGITGTLTFPEGLQTIGGGAFEGCTGIQTTLTFPSTLQTIDFWAFKNCTGITGTLTFPSALQTIGNEAFKGCTGLQGDLTFSDNIKIVGDEAFADAGFAGGVIHMGMQNNAGVTLGSEAFRGSHFSRIIVEGERPVAVGCAFAALTSDSTIWDSWHVDSKYQIALTIAPSVRELPNRAFSSMYVTGHVDIPSTVTSIGDEAFVCCRKLTSVSWPANITEIPVSCFENSSVASITIPDGITKINERAFSGCTKLHDPLHFSPNLTYIGDFAFQNCYSIPADVATLLPPSLTTLGSGAFLGCHGIKGEAVLPNTVHNTSGGSSWRVNPMVGTGCYGIKMGQRADFFQPYSVNNKNTNWYGSQYGGGTISYQNLLYIDTRDCMVALTNIKNMPNTCYKFSRENYLYNDEEIYGNFGNMAMNALVYLPSESVFLNSALPQKTFAERFEFNSEYPNEEDAKGENFIMDGKCQRFYVQDGLDYRVPYAFTAIEARCSRVFSGTSCKTLYLPYATDMPTGLRAYKLTDEGGQSPNAPGYDHTFIFTSIPDGTPLEANKPYLVRVTDGQEHRLPVMHNVEVPVSPDMQTTADMATFNSHWKFMGTTEKVDNAKAASLHAYNLKNNVWHPITSANTNGHIDPFRCFVSGDGTAPAKLFAMVLEGETDGIDNIADVKASEADVRSGRYMFYTLDGKSMGKSFDALPSGEMYVVNGKKFYKF